VSGQQHAPAPLYRRERPGSRFTGGWVGPRAGLDGRKISSPPGFDPRPSSPQQTAVLHLKEHKVEPNVVPSSIFVVIAY